MLQCILLCLVYALHPGPAHSLICFPLFLSLPDEIISTLGEGTFGRVVQCIDHRRYVRSWDGEGGKKRDHSWRWSFLGLKKRDCGWPQSFLGLMWQPGGENKSLGFSAGLRTHPFGSPSCWREVGGAPGLFVGREKALFWQISHNNSHLLA